MLNENDVTKSCRMIAYDSPTFQNEVMDALRTDRVFAITGLPDVLQTSMKDLFESGDDFFDHIHEFEKDLYPAKLETNNVRGLFLPETHPLLCNNGARFFTAMNKNGGINNERMPLLHGKPVMSDASKVFNEQTNLITARILEAIENELNLTPNGLQDAILGDGAIGFTRFFPITQKRAAHMFEENVLAIKDDGVEQFNEHRDVNPLTMLAYRGDDTRGLMVQDRETKKQVPLKVDAKGQPYLVIFTGRLLKELTNGNISALKHQVVTTPEDQHLEAQNDPHSWRFTLAKFTYLDKPEVVPAKTHDGADLAPPKKRKHDRQYPVSQASFFLGHFATQAQVRDKANAKVFPLEVAKKYPTEVKYKELYEAQLGEDNFGAYQYSK